MNIDIPLDGTNIDDPVTDKDGISLLIMREAFLDAFKDSEENCEYTEKVTEKEIKE